jgi:A/G-specific adenine glycosylase
MAQRPAEHPDLDAAIVGTLVAWFERHRRELPWRSHDQATGGRDPYRVLVSEVMLQQTQVARVVEKFAGFLDTFPDVHALASAPEERVLAAWTGLGYYRRARLLHAASKVIVADFQGSMPRSIEELRSLPGVGVYTAGAIASLALGQAEALVDTNVSRVLMRIGGVDARVADRDTQAWVWTQARRLVLVAAELPPSSRGEPGSAAWNEGLMELGALVCTARSPACGVCPLRARCAAHAAGVQHQIPRAKETAARGAIVHVCVVVRDRSGRLLLEQRGHEGLWGGLWQVPTLELKSEQRVPGGGGVAALVKRLALPAGRATRGVTQDFVFKTTHRDVRFVVRGWTVDRRIARATRGRWCTLAEALKLGMSSPMRRIVRDACMTVAARGVARRKA